ncbi:DUF1989 domain-containing protein [Chloroflexota bacterium]
MVSLGKLVQRRVIPGGHGGAIIVKEGQYLKVINLEGKQICDFFAFNPSDPRQFLSGSHTRVLLSHAVNTSKPIMVGSPLLDNTRQPMLILEEDIVRVHDWLLAACNSARYSVDYGIPNHRNCKMNVIEALAEFHIRAPAVPDPLNLFQNSPYDAEGEFTIYESVAKPGDYVLFRALRTILAVGSACPQDQNPANAYQLTDIAFEVYDPA